MATVVDRTLRRTAKVRRNIRRAAGGRARLSVFRSSKHIYAQVIDDVKGETLASASSLEKSMREGKKTGANVDAESAPREEEQGRDPGGGPHGKEASHSDSC